MGQLTSNKIVNSQQWKEVISHQTYINTSGESKIPPCSNCGNGFKRGDTISRIQTSNGIEYYHYDKCLKGVELISENTN